MLDLKVDFYGKSFSIVPFLLGNKPMGLCANKNYFRPLK